MKKVLITFLFIFVGVLFGAGTMFAFNKINEKKIVLVEDKNAVEDKDVEEEIVFEDGYYSVYYQQCDMTLPFPEAVNFSYLDSNSPDFIESSMDNDKGWYLKDSVIIEDQSMFFKHFERQVSASLVALPHSTVLGSGYIASYVNVMCYQDTTETLDEAFDRIAGEVEAAESIDEFEPFAIKNKNEVTYNGRAAVQFSVSGGFFGDSIYTLVRNETHVYLIQNITMSSDDNIKEAAEYIETNIQL